MADVNKTIEISMTADLKNLQKQLSKIPGMTKEEAQAMTKALQRELKQAQAEARKTAEVNKKAMRQVKVSTDAAAKSAKNLRTQSREMGGAFGALEDVVGELAPELSGTAMAIGTVGSAFRTLSRSLATGNPLVLALVAAVAAATAAYHIFTAEARAAEKQQKLLAEAAEKTTEKMKAQRDIATEVVTAHRNASTELAVFTGQMTQLQADMQSVRDDAADQLAKQTETQDQYIKEQQNSLALVQKAKQSYSQLTEEEQNQLDLLVATAKARQVNKGLASTQAGITGQMRTLEVEINQSLSKEVALRDRIVAKNKETEDIQIQLLQLQEEMRKEQEEEEKRQERIAKAREAAAERDRQLNEASNAAIQSKASTEERIQQIQIARLSQEEQINANAEKRKADLEAEKTAIYEQYLAAEKIAKTDKEKAKLKQLDIEAAQAFAALTQEQNEVENQRILDQAELKRKVIEEETKLREKQAEEIAKKEEELNAQYMKMQELRLNTLSSALTFGLQLATEAGEKNKTLINVLFRANQAASIANIAMKTAEAVAAAPAQYGPLAPAAIPAIIASGAVQAGIVLAQKPPLHMGGIVQPLAPDEQSRTLLTGEAVLDRATTRRLGEDGIQKLQNGKNTGPDVIVMNPYKHLDRYNRSALRNPNSSFARLTPTPRQRY